MKQTVAIIGGGPAAMSLACHIDSTQYATTIYERHQSIGRKFLVAGKGGFNLTYDEALVTFKQQYRPDGCMDQCLNTFTPAHWRKWLANIGIPTYTGTSSRVFPEKEIKPINVLNAIKSAMEKNQVVIMTEMKWTGWDQNENLTFEDGQVISADIVVFALGGGSWKVTGSDGSWLDSFEKIGIETSGFKAVNCGFTVEWSNTFIEKYGGLPLKNIVVTHHESSKTGELLMTDYGVEGNAIYALSHSIQEALSHNQITQISIDLKPSMSIDQIDSTLKNSKNPISRILTQNIKLSKVAIQLLKSNTTKAEFLDASTLASKIKGLIIEIGQPRSLDEAISTIGGIPYSALSDDYEIISKNNHYCIGEMVDWYAPTGGYLLQGCISMGAHLAQVLSKRI